MAPTIGYLIETISAHIDLCHNQTPIDMHVA